MYISIQNGEPLKILALRNHEMKWALIIGMVFQRIHLANPSKYGVHAYLISVQLILS